jgi:hypothetical protein
MKKNIKIFLFFFLSLLIFNFATNLQVKADCGPKASVSVEITGFKNEKYVATLVSKRASGPNFTYQDWLEGEWDYLFYHPIMEYHDEDGFMWVGKYWELEGQNQFAWNYYPPMVFKIILFTEDGKVYSSQVLERYAFNSYFLFDGENVESTEDEDLFIGKAVKSYDYSLEVWSFLVRMIVTILIEIVILILFGYRSSKSLKLVLIVNVITQLGLNLLLNIVGYYQSSLVSVIIYVFLELLVITGEAIFYSFFLKEKSRLRAALYGVTANIASFGIGLGFYILFL